jgi:hypothetical protein
MKRTERYSQNKTELEFVLKKMPHPFQLPLCCVGTQTEDAEARIGIWRNPIAAMSLPRQPKLQSIHIRIHDIFNNYSVAIKSLWIWSELVLIRILRFQSLQIRILLFRSFRIRILLFRSFRILRRSGSGSCPQTQPTK